MEKPPISIIIPTKNEERTINACLKSVFTLNYPKFEVVIVDGNSKDNTIKIAKKYPVKIFYENKGMRGVACNIGIKNSKYNYVAFTDADCVVNENWLNSLVDCFENERIAGVGGPNITPKEDSIFSRSVGFVLNSFMGSGNSIQGRVFKEKKNVSSIAGCNSLYKKKSIMEIGGFDEKLITCEDTDLNLRLINKGFKLLYTPDSPVIHYRRVSPKRFFNQIFRYSIGRASLIKKNIRGLSLLHFFPSLFLITLVLLFLFGKFTVFSYLLFTYFFVTFVYGISWVKEIRNYKVVFFVPLVYMIEHLAWGMGFIYGWFKK